jgi:hypothetical protein
VCISNNNFSPLDGEIVNIANYCVYVAPGATRVVGDIGTIDPTTAHAITNAQNGASPWTALSYIGAVIQGSGVAESPPATLGTRTAASTAWKLALS